MSKRRVIFHIDMNSFYASVEAAHDPTLKGKPLAIAGRAEERRGIIVTCSYEARKYGVKTTMPVWQGMKLCPNLIIRPPDFTKYKAASQAIFQLLREYTSLVEPVSIDEGYLDVTNYINKNPIRLAETIQQRILRELKLPCSIGIAPNKFLAKMASDMKKPLGITILRKRDIQKILWPMPVIEMHGVGKKTAEKLAKLNIKTIGDLARSNRDILKAVLGIHGARLFDRANGMDDRPVDPEAITEFKSIGNSTTLPADTVNIDKIQKVFQNLSEEVSARMMRKNVFARNIQITIRYSNRKTITRSKQLINPIQSSIEIYKMAIELFHKYWNKQPIRLVGVTSMDLIEQQFAYKQLDLFSFEKDQKEWKVEQIIDELQQKYGEDTIKKGIQVNEAPNIRTSFNKDFLR